MSEPYMGLAAEEELDYILLSQRDPGPVLDELQIKQFSQQEIWDRFDSLVDHTYLTLVPRFLETHGKMYLKNPTWELTRIGRHRLDELIEKRTAEPFDRSGEFDQPNV